MRRRERRAFCSKVWFHFDDTIKMMSLFFHIILFFFSRLEEFYASSSFFVF